MPIIFKSPLSSAVANQTWLDKTQDDATVGKVSLNNTDTESGATIANAQKEINAARTIVFGEAPRNNGDTLTLDAISFEQEVRMVGSGGAVTLNVLPFTGAKIVEDGCVIRLVGHDDTNTVTIPFNDVQFGCYINGDATLKRGYILTLVYNDELERYLEIGRNF